MKTCLRLTFFMCLLPTLTARAQVSAPEWVQDAYRERSYPAQEWYTGFAPNQLKAGDNLGDALKALEQEAQNRLAQKIVVTIKGESEMVNTSQQRPSGGKTAEILTSDYTQVVRTATSATTVRTEVKSYHNPKTGALYAFAAVRRADLAAYYRKQIDVELGRVDATLGIAGQLATAGKKISARSKVGEAKKMLSDVAPYGNLLVAVNPAVDKRELQTARANSLQRIVEQLLIDLEQSTFIYMSCSHESKGGKNDAFDSDPNILCDIIAQALSENDCSVTDNKDEADFELTLITSTTQRSDGTVPYGIISYYANARGTLYNRAANKTTVNFSILNDPDCYSAGRSPEDAATKAFKLPELTNKVLEKILPKIRD